MEEIDPRINSEHWLAYGVAMGWAEPFCYSHDLPPMTDEESSMMWDNGEVCIPTLRVWL